MYKPSCTAPGCPNGTSGGRYCTTHFRRLKVHGSLDAPPRPSADDRFWAKVEKSSDCWLWTAATDRDGYGRFHEGHKLPVWYAHRYAYTACVGPIPDDLTLDHLCRTRNCVRPEHLEPVTNHENLMRGVGPSARQAKQTHCIHGHELEPYRPGCKRTCKECQRLHSKRQWQRKLARRQEAAAC